MARLRPAPAAAPRTMAMLGLGISCSQREVSIRDRKADAFSSRLLPEVSRPSAMALTSPPAQNARPAPVRTTTPTSGLSARRGNASSRASSMGPLRALSRSGRFMVSTATPSLTTSCRSALMAALRTSRGDGAAYHTVATLCSVADGLLASGQPHASVLSQYVGSAHGSLGGREPHRGGAARGGHGCRRRTVRRVVLRDQRGDRALCGVGERQRKRLRAVLLLQRGLVRLAHRCEDPL